MKEIQKSIIEELIKNELNIEVQIKDFSYFKNGTSPKYLSYTTHPVIKDDVFILGRIFAEIYEDHLKLLPSFFDLCISLEIITVNWRKVVDLSYGKNVKLDATDGIYLVRDKYDRTIALCEIKNHNCSPIVDIGYYLREED